jgi:hypothetical protein
LRQHFLSTDWELQLQRHIPLGCGGGVDGLFLGFSKFVGIGLFWADQFHAIGSGHRVSSQIGIDHDQHFSLRSKIGIGRLSKKSWLLMTNRVARLGEIYQF